MTKKKDSQHYEQYLLRGKLRKAGSQRIRYVFNGVNRETNTERTFFIEIILVNPAVSPVKPVVYCENSAAGSADESPDTLYGKKTIAAQVQPQSYVLLKAGSYGPQAQQFKRYYSLKDFIRQKGQNGYKIGNCIFGINVLAGSVVVGQNDLLEHPELDCAAGSISWEVRFDQKIHANPLYKKHGLCWTASGVKTLFSGTIRMSGLEYAVVPKKSFGYIDRFWAPDFVQPFFHLSSSHLVSIINGNPLQKSCLALGGEFGGSLTAFLMLEGQVLPVQKRWFLEKWNEVHHFSQVPADADGEKLHWSVSIHKKNFVVDIDVFCKSDEMLVQGCDMLQAGRDSMHIVSGGSGFGEIRIYKKMGKSLELLEDARIESALCEYGAKIQ